MSALSSELAAVAIASLGGIVMALLMPRGPVDANQALLLIASGLAIGIAAGMLMRSRWAFLLTPLTTILAFELTRMDSSGPNVDGIHLGTTFGILAFVTGRGVLLMLGVIPLMLGVVYGRRFSSWRGSEHSRSRSRMRNSLRWVAMSLPAIGLAAIAIWIAQPASVPSVTANDGSPLPGSVSELTALQIGDSEQWISMRGASEELPVLLYLSGGPGQSDLALSRALLDELTRDFIVVGWDQRGTGKSYPAYDSEMITPDVFVADAVEVTNYLRERFDEEKIYLLGESWGSLLGILTIQARPDLYHAYIGSG